MVSLGDDFESANAAVMYYARDVVSNARLGSGEEQKENKAFATGDETTKLWQDNWYDGLSYCKFRSLLARGPPLTLQAPGTHSGNVLQKKKFLEPWMLSPKTISTLRTSL